MSLTVLERLQDIAELQNIDVERYDLPKKVRGLYYEEDNYRVITINADVDTAAEEVDIMAEEIGHSVVGGGDLLFPDTIDPVIKRKAELRAKNYGYNLVLPVKSLISALIEGTEMWEIAEIFSVTEKLVIEAIEAYKRKGLIPEFNDYYD